MSLTCVSAYFPVKNKYDNKYLEWFNNSLCINCPYIFFTTSESIELIKSFRKELPTYYIECTIEEFYTYQYKDRMIHDSYHCPSVELNLIWNEKIFMLQKAYELNPFNSEWFHWIDAGICIYRDVKPPDTLFPNEEILTTLPKDKFIYSSSNLYEESSVSTENYYHHIAGTSYLLYKDMIPLFKDMYKEYIDKLLNDKIIWTDQIILTHIYKENPELFHKICDGYGEVTRYLY